MDPNATQHWNHIYTRLCQEKSHKSRNDGRSVSICLESIAAYLDGQPAPRHGVADLLDHILGRK